MPSMKEYYEKFKAEAEANHRDQEMPDELEPNFVEALFAENCPYCQAERSLIEETETGDEHVFSYLCSVCGREWFMKQDESGKILEFGPLESPPKPED